jgi:hypothetical protein
MVQSLLDDKSIKPSDKLNWSIIRAAMTGHSDIIEILLNDERIDPTVKNNNAIICAYNQENQKIIKLLWNDKRVKATLQNDFIELYEQLTEEDIKKNIKDKVFEF